MKPEMLIIDDEEGICAALTIAFESTFKVYTASNAASGLDIAKNCLIDLVLLDLRIGSDDGLEVLDKIKSFKPEIVVIMMTAYGTIRSSVDALKRGAYSYLTKPLNMEELLFTVEQAMSFKRLNERVEYLNSELLEKYKYGEMIGNSPAMQKIYSLIDRVKDSNISIVITGESGTGKELAARAVHFLGNRKNERFVEINCAAIPEGLLEEELFGHKRGSYTSAVSDRKGKFAYADKGTIFLDEIGAMPFNLQAKILRVLQQMEYTPIGSNEKIKIDVRVIAATNSDLKKMVADGKFRQDLYYRLNVVNICMPPLRERKKDIPILCNSFLKEINNEQNCTAKGFSHDALRVLLSYDYPGNVRELRNIIEYASVFAKSDVIDASDFPASLSESLKTSKNALETTIPNKDDCLNLRELEKQAIIAALKKYNWHKQDAANALGISDRTLRNKLHEYNLEQN